ncbi:MAG: peptidoglycan DD-metalloendopeptidase family protein [Thermodesulfobacteriota bacterium]
MGKDLHFVITSERGQTRAFTVTRDALKLIAACCAFIVLFSCAGWFLFSENLYLRRHAASVQQELAETTALNKSIREEAARREQEQQRLLDTTLTDLRQRGQVIETILNAVGIDLDVEESSKNAGGPFTMQDEGAYERFSLMVDKHIDIIRALPLGPPTRGTLTSFFGNRIDPINNRPAFHSGVDIRCPVGTKVTAPADGVVVGRGFSGDYGNYLEIKHGKGFQTRYFHLQKQMVNEGDQVRRGQVIALTGNSGRSTGSHLHYEVFYRNRLVDPTRFIQIRSRIAAHLDRQQGG